MNEMITFCTAVLEAVADFLGTPPIFYLFCLICLGVIVRIFLGLFKNHY